MILKATQTKPDNDTEIATKKKNRRIEQKLQKTCRHISEGSAEIAWKLLATGMRQAGWKRSSENEIHEEHVI